MLRELGHHDIEFTTDVTQGFPPLDVLRMSGCGAEILTKAKDIYSAKLLDLEKRKINAGVASEVKEWRVQCGCPQRDHC